MADTTRTQDGAAQPVNIQSQDRAVDDPFANQRTKDNNPFAEDKDRLADLGSSPPSQPNSPQDRRMSKEWDASKVPPSRFQKKEGSIYATPGSRDGHVDRNQQTKFLDKLKEKKWL